MFKRRRILLDLNDIFVFDFQFGNVEDLFRGVKCQIFVCVLESVYEENVFIWFRLVIKFFECLGIEEILKEKVESIKCILSLNMDILINLLVIKDVQVDLILSFLDYIFMLDRNDVVDGIRLRKILN